VGRKRQGPCSTIFQTTAGPATIAWPKLRGTDEAFAECPGEPGYRRIRPSVLVCDLKASLADALGAEDALFNKGLDSHERRSRTALSLEGPGSLRGEPRVAILGGSQLKMHDAARAEPVLAAWGITTGHPVLVGLDS